MVTRRKQFESRLDQIATTVTQKWSKRARDTHIQAVYLIFFRTKNGVAQLVHFSEHIRGEYSARYNHHIAQMKKIAPKRLSHGKLAQLAFRESMAYLRRTIDFQKHILVTDNEIALETHLTCVGKYLLNKDKKKLPKKKGVLEVTLFLDSSALEDGFAEVHNPTKNDAITPFQHLIRTLVFTIPLSYSMIYDVKGLDTKS